MGEASRKTIAVALMLFVLLASSTLNSFTSVRAEVADADYLIKTTVTFFNNGTDIWNLTQEDREISLFMNNTWQTVYLTEHSRPIERTETDEDGNLIAILQLPDLELEHGEAVNYTLTYHVESELRLIPHLDEEESGALTEIPENLIERYRNASDTWQIDDPTLQELARSIADNQTNVLSIVEELIEWIWNNIDYPPQDNPKISHEVPIYPNQTLLHEEGDCDDQAILFITLCRILGIPSYLQVGCIYDYGFQKQQSSWNNTVTSVLEHIAWHGWAMVYVPPWGWLPVDLTYVTGGRGAPLNAIRTGAVTSSETIQYMNISQRDYVTSSHTYRDFLIENNFLIHQRDEMSSTSQVFLDLPIEMWIQWFLIAAGIIGIGTFVVVLGYVWKAERRRSDEFKRNERRFSLVNT
ncbi:MAG: transglutaminase domain-containing protein [Candidatus Bathyarchaeota archaeon]|nr:MAG: transglutaminase domain-containing protein [Candidatus Bathyarchaeota archaeon]